MTDANYARVTEITDEHVTYLSQLPALEYLFLDTCEVTAPELERLKRLRTLRVIQLGDFVITTKGRVGNTIVINLEAVKKLQEALPECEIVY